MPKDSLLGNNFASAPLSLGRRSMNFLITFAAGAAVFLVLLPLGAIFAYLIYKGIGSWSGSFFTTDPSGIPGQEIVLPTQVSVISPTPGGPADGPATGAYLTLTTCHPKGSATHRLVIRAQLESPTANQPAPA